MTEPAPSPNSPLPWHVDNFGDVCDADGRRVSITSCDRKALAAAAFIVECVNAHATLTAERDAALFDARLRTHERDYAQRDAECMAANVRAAESARDAALAEVARLSSEVARLAAALERAPIPHDYNEKHGFDIQRFIVDFTTWRVTARAALAPKGAPDV